MIVLLVKMKQRITNGKNKQHFDVPLENTLHLIPILKVCGFVWFFFENVRIFGIFIWQHCSILTLFTCDTFVSKLWDTWHIAYTFLYSISQLPSPNPPISDPVRTMLMNIIFHQSEKSKSCLSLLICDASQVAFLHTEDSQPNCGNK